MFARRLFLPVLLNYYMIIPRIITFVSRPLFHEYYHVVIL